MVRKRTEAMEAIGSESEQSFPLVSGHIDRDTPPRPFPNPQSKARVPRPKLPQILGKARRLLDPPIAGEEGPMRRCATKIVEAAAANAKRKAEEMALAGKLGVLVNEGSTKRKAAAGCSEGGKAAAADAVATAAAEGEEAAKVAATVAEEKVTAVKAAEAVAEEQVAAAKAAEAVAEEEMKATDFIVAYKRLPRREINFTLAQVRMPFESTSTYRDLVADGATPEDLDREAAEYEEEQDDFFTFQERVRRDYEEKGVVEVDDEYIAKRLEMQATIDEGWSTMMDDLDLHDSDFGSYPDELEDMDEVTSSAMGNREVEAVAA
ncbi:hypothetical protein ACP70R_008184 [Stipagrostis hirtigluma subsp. patula]